jgi:hypothetical protein
VKRWNLPTGVRAASALLALSPLSAVHADDWQHTVLFYGMGAALDGTAQVGPVEVPVDMSISDVFDALELGAMAAYRAENGTWSFTVDATYFGMGGHSKTGRGLLKGDADVDQTTLMGTVGRRVTDRLDVLASLSYFDLSTDVMVKVTNPVSGEVTRQQAGTSASWVDPLLGLHYGVPVNDDWTVHLRGDVGGFGIGSDLSYQLIAAMQWKSSGKLGAAFGYRVIGFDYEDGNRDSAGYERYDLTEQGPFAGVTWTF